jgi:hypothetical protein
VNPSLEENIPINLIIIVFVAMAIISHFLRRWLRKRRLIQDGQLAYDSKRVPTIEERLRQNRNWANGKIQSQGLSAVIILWTATLVWFLTFGVAFFKFLTNPDAHLGQKIITGVFSLGGFVFLYFALRFTARQFRYGKSCCLIDGKAGILGKQISGRIRTTKEIVPTGDFKFLLQCIDSYSTGTGKNRTTQTRVEFQAVSTVPAAGIRSSRTGIPFSISLPSYPPETGSPTARGILSWQLRVDAPVKGIDYLAMFIVPVFKIV